MTFSNPSWYPLSTWDPVPGDPVAVRTAGQGYEKVAAEIQTAAVNLRGIADSLTQRSDAVDEVQTKARKVAGQIERAHGRYAATGAALVTYAAGLAQAQQIAQDALRQAQNAAAAQDNAHQDMCYWSGRGSEVFPGEPAADFTGQIDTARQNLFQSDRHLDAARAALGTATAMRDDAGEAARASIQAVGLADDLHDTVWQNLGGGTQEVGLWVWNGADEAAAALGVLALALCWVPVVGEALGAVSLIAGMLLLIRDGVNWATGNGKWDAVAIDAAGLATFGVGRVAGQGLKMASESAAAAKALRATATVAEEGDVVVSSAAKAAASATSRGGAGFHVAASADAPARFSKAAELFGVLNPKTVASETVSDLSGGVKLFRASSSGVAHAHVGPPGNFGNPFREGSLNAGKGFNGASVFKAIGQDDAARNATLLARNEGFGTALHWKAGGVSAGGFGAAKFADAGLVGYNGIEALK